MALDEEALGGVQNQVTIIDYDISNYQSQWSTVSLLRALSDGLDDKFS
jgi:hypothetical protein